MNVLILLSIVLLYLSKKSISVKDVVSELKKGNGQYSKRDLHQINKIVVHHSATNSGTPSAYANFHVDSRGFPGIAYHYVIQKNGEIFLTNYIDTISYHTSGQNTSSIGICLTGNYDNQLPEKKQLIALDKLIEFLRNKIGVNLKVFGHYEFAQKSCPGENIKQYIKKYNE